MPNTLSKESEKRILDALEKASELTSSGMHPNDALIKVASEARIPAGHIRLMVNATNTGKTNAQRLASDDPFEKAAEFPLADAATILSALYPDDIKTKAAAYLETAVADEYRQSPSWLKEKAAREKAARAVEWKLTDKKPIIERDPDHAVKKAYGAAQKLHQEIEAQRMELARCRNAAEKVAAALRTYFMKPGHISFQEVAENSELLFGKSASVVLNIAKPKKEAHFKSDSTPVSMTLEPYRLVKEAMALATAFIQQRRAYDETVKTANCKARELLRPFGPGPEQGFSVLGDLCLPPELTKVGFLGNFVARGLGMMTAGDVAREVARKMGPQPSSTLEQKDLSDLMDPGHDMEIRNIQSEALLNDLLANDDMIKGYDPEEAIDAFNEVSQIAPYAMRTKAIMRDLMRKRLAGGASALDQFTVGDTLGQQQKLREMNSPNEDALHALQSMGVMNGPSKSKSVLGDIGK
jgi:hypothetical protein